MHPGSVTWHSSCPWVAWAMLQGHGAENNLDEFHMTQTEPYWEPWPTHTRTRTRTCTHIHAHTHTHTKNLVQKILTFLLVTLSLLNVPPAVVNTHTHTHTHRTHHFNSFHSHGLLSMYHQYSQPKLDLFSLTPPIDLLTYFALKNLDFVTKTLSFSLKLSLLNMPPEFRNLNFTKKTIFSQK